MVFSDILSLIGLAKDFTDRRSIIDKDYFTNFIQPAWDAFVKIHADYETSIRKYSDDFSNTDLPLDELMSWLIKQVEQDVIYSRSLKTELHEMVINSPQMRATKNQQLLDDFVGAISRYFDIKAALLIEKDVEVPSGIYIPGGNEIKAPPSERNAKVDYTIIYPTEGENNISMYSNVRDIIPIFLYRNKKANKVEIASVFTKIVQNLQEKYAGVAQAYYTLKSELLK